MGTTIKYLISLIILFAPIILHAQYSVARKTIGTGGERIVTNWIRGYVINGNGEKQEGEIQLKIVNGDTTEVKLKGADGKKVNFMRSEIKGYDAILLVTDVKNDYKDPSRNFHPGYVLYRDGIKKEGQVATLKKTLSDIEVDDEKLRTYGPWGVKYADADLEITIYKALETDIIYFVQVIDGEDTHYINYGGSFLEIHNPTGRFSYFRNPRPTHLREAMTEIAKGAAQELVNEASKEIAQAVAKKSLEKSKKNGDDMFESMGNSTIAAMEAYELTQNVFNVEDAGGIYFIEYVVVDNENATKKIIYKKNIREVVAEFLSGCEVSDDLIKEEIDMNNLEYVMEFLEAEMCD